jgi:stress response protein SCP2
MGVIDSTYKGDNDEWKFKALGEGNQNDLLQEMHKYGIPAEGNA